MLYIQKDLGGKPANDEEIWMLRMNFMSLEVVGIP